MVEALSLAYREGAGQLSAIADRVMTMVDCAVASEGGKVGKQAEADFSLNRCQDGASLA
jgi:hypothetical protein